MHLLLVMQKGYVYETNMIDIHPAYLVIQNYNEYLFLLELNIAIDQEILTIDGLLRLQSR